MSYRKPASALCLAAHSPHPSLVFSDCLTPPVLLQSSSLFTISSPCPVPLLMAACPLFFSSSLHLQHCSNSSLLLLYHEEQLCRPQAQCTRRVGCVEVLEGHPEAGF